MVNNKGCSGRFESVLEWIGKSPLIRLSLASRQTGWDVYGKWEVMNPGGSVKDRIALAMVLSAEAQGHLVPGGTIVEPTSGNTGIGLAMVAAARGYRAMVTMPDTVSLERRSLLQGYGAEVVLTPGSEGMLGAIRRAEQLVAGTPGAVMLHQFENQANPGIHYETTGPEIWEATEGQVNALIAGVGTGGTVTGVGRYLKEKNLGITIVGVEPEESAVLTGGHAGPHLIQGIGAGFVPGVLDRTWVDKMVTVSGADAFSRVRELMRQEGMAVGISSGAAVAAAIRVLPEIGSQGMAVVMLPDGAERYLSTALFSGFIEEGIAHDRT